MAIVMTASLTASAQVPELMYFKFDGAGGTVPNLAQAPVGTQPATIGGSLTQGGTGQFGGGLIGSGLSSATDFLDTGWATSLSGSWTISLYLDDIPSSSTLFYFFGDATASSFRCFTNGVAGANNLMLRGPLVDVLAPGGAQINTPTVTHFVYDSTVPEIRAYVNGVLVNTVAQPALTVSGTGPFKVNGYATQVGNPLGGVIDEFRMYNRALSAAEVAATWNVDLITDNAPPTGECAHILSPLPKTIGFVNNGFYRVSGSDAGSGLATIKLGTFALTNGEIIRLLPWSRPGVTYGWTIGGYRQFYVGPGAATLALTDVAGNTASVACSVP